MNSKTFHYIQEYFVQIHFIPSCLCALCQTKHSAKPGVHNKIFCSSISQFFLNVYHKCHNLHKLHKKVYQYTLQVAIYLQATYILPTHLVYLLTSQSSQDKTTIVHCKIWSTIMSLFSRSHSVHRFNVFISLVYCRHKY